MPNADKKKINDATRLNVLRNLCLLDTPADPAFDRLTNLASRILKAPVSLVSLVDQNRQFFKSQIGLPEPLATERETPLSHSFCQHAVATSAPLVVDNAREHALVFDNPAVDEFEIISYLGIPLITSDGLAIGSFCVIDHVERHWTDEEIEIIKDLTASVMTEIELRAEIVQRQQVEQNLRERKHFINQVMKTLPSLLFIYDVEHEQIIYINKSLDQVLHQRIEPGDPVTALFPEENFHPMDYVKLMAMREQVIQSDDDEPTSLDYRFKFYDDAIEDDWRWANITGKPFLSDEDGNVTQVLCMIRDVTADKRQLDQDIKIMLEKEQIRMMSEFIRNTSHDLRTPLTMIQTNLDLIRRSNDPVRVEERLERMQERIHQMAHVLDEFVAMGELYKQSPVKGHHVNINEVVGEAVGVLLKRYRISSYVREAFGAGLPPVYGDADQLRHAVYALLENAVLHADMHDTALEVSTTLRKDQVIVQVRDYGDGIEAEALKNVFDLFFKGNAARTPNGSGSGLGLAMVKKIISLHGGTVEAQSEAGEGTIMTIVLPAAMMPVV